MKILILLLAVLMIGCRVKQASIPPRSDGSLVGSYYRGDGTGYNVYLDLLANGTYTAKWRGCLGEYGTARGTWTSADDRIVLSPSDETDMMKGHLRDLHIAKHKGQTVFVPDLRDDYYRKYGADEYAAFHRQTKQ